MMNRMMMNTLMASAVLLMGLCPAARAAVTGGVVQYEDFGAKGDGKTDDLPAIIRAHEAANAKGLPVKAKAGATYYLGGTSNGTAVIRTDTDFGSAKFIIDDTKVSDRKKSVFEVSSALAPIKVEKVATLKQNQARLDVKLPQPCLVMVVNDKVKHFVRRGANHHAGVPQQDLFLVDAEGNVDPATAIVWDFAAITSILAYPLDKATLKITGGHFTTVANMAKSEYNYFGRGIAIRRSNTVIDGLEHHITGEKKQSAPYSGFITIGSCANVTIRNGVFTAHKTYKAQLKGVKKTMGTYDIGVGRALNVSFVNCRQSNDIFDRSCWGIMCSNGGKNLVYDGCTLNRFDAHQGVANATIRNSTIGYGGIEVIGMGTLLIENTNKGAYLREDYGSSWRGEMIIRNCTFKTDGGTLVLLNGRNNGQHHYGYTAQMPERITIENVHIEDKNPPVGYEGPAVLGNFNPVYKDASYVEKVPYIKTKEIILKNVTTASGKPLRVSINPVMFRDVVMRTEK